MNQAYLLYSADAWLMHSSMKLLAVFDYRVGLAIYLKGMMDAGLITDEDCDALLTVSQTNGREENYIILTEPLNPRYNP